MTAPPPKPCDYDSDPYGSGFELHHEELHALLAEERLRREEADRELGEALSVISNAATTLRWADSIWEPVGTSLEQKKRVPEDALRKGAEDIKTFLSKDVPELVSEFEAFLAAHPREGTQP